jgi:hypothetical protein
MQRHARFLVRALLPVLILVVCQALRAPADSVAASGPSGPTGPTGASVHASENRAPTISAAATDVAQVGKTYDYQPQAADPDGDALQFSATNLPPWASMDPTNGHISGTPGENDLGIYESITITVADATRRTESAPFSITVIGDPSTGVASLQWERPLSKVDGSPIDDLAGYRILYGRSADDLDRSVLISDPSQTSYEIDSLARGIWYFAVVAVNAGGLEGPPTVVGSKSI